MKNYNELQISRERARELVEKSRGEKQDQDASPWDAGDFYLRTYPTTGRKELWLDGYDSPEEVIESGLPT